MRFLRRGLSRIAGMVARMFGIGGSGRLLQSIAMSQSGFVRPRTDLEWEIAYGINSRFRGPVEAIAEDVATAVRRMRVVRKTVAPTGEVRETEVAYHAFKTLLENPHPGMTAWQWTKSLYSYFLVNGKALVWIRETDRIGRPTYLEIVPPHDVVEGPCNSKPFWVFNWGAETKTVTTDRILYLHDPDLLNPMEGVGRARGLDDDVQQDEAMSKFNNSFFRNHAFLGAIVNIPGEVDLDEVEEKWRQRWSGIKNAFRAFFVGSEQPITVTNLTPKLSEMSFTEGREQARDFIAGGLRVTLERLGITKNTTRGNLEASDFHQQNYNVLPLLTLHQDWLNKFVAPLFDYELVGLAVRFDNPVKESESIRWTGAEAGCRAGFMTIDEARVRVGLDPLPGGRGNVLMIPVNNVVLVPADSDLVQSAMLAAENLNGRSPATGGTQ